MLALMVASVALGCVTTRDRATVAPVMPGKPFPIYRTLLGGTNALRVINPRAAAVRVAVRSGTKGITFDVPPAEKASVRISPGTFDVYFLYADRPAAAYQGDSFTVDRQALEIVLSTEERGGYVVLKEH